MDLFYSRIPVRTHTPPGAVSGRRSSNTSELTQLHSYPLHFRETHCLLNAAGCPGTINTNRLNSGSNLPAGRLQSFPLSSKELTPEWTAESCAESLHFCPIISRSNMSADRLTALGDPYEAHIQRMDGFLCDTSGAAYRVAPSEALQVSSRAGYTVLRTWQHPRHLCRYDILQSYLRYPAEARRPADSFDPEGCFLRQP